MSTNDDFYAWLAGQAGVSAICSDRIYPGTIPQGSAYPCIRFSRDEDGGFKDFDGQGVTIRVDMQVDNLADTLDEATDLAQAVRASLKNYTGAMTSRYVQRTSLDATFDDYEPNLADGKFRVSQAWTIWLTN